MPDDSLNEENLSSARTRAERLRFLREKVLRVSRAEMEQMTTISEASIENWEYARYSGLTERGAKRIENASQKMGINCTAKWLLYGIGKGPDVHIWASANKPKDNVPELSQEEIITEELQLFHRLNKHAIDFIIQDGSMLPFFQPGDYVAGIQHFDKDFGKAINQICIVKTMMGDISIRILKAGTEQGYYSLHCTNQNKSASLNIENIKLFSAAPILWSRRKSLL